MYAIIGMHKQDDFGGTRRVKVVDTLLGKHGTNCVNQIFLPGLQSNVYCFLEQDFYQDYKEIVLV